VVVDDAMGQVLWTRHFLSAQGVHVPTTTIYQDNMSIILLAENGRSSSSKRTRHINVRYYFLTDQIKNGQVKIAYCLSYREHAGGFLSETTTGKRIQEHA